MTEQKEGGRLRSGGQLVIDALLAHGVRRIFGVPGESFLPILAACRSWVAGRWVWLWRCGGARVRFGRLSSCLDRFGSRG